MAIIDTIAITRIIAATVPNSGITFPPTISTSTVS
jgi:hypothetical protein